MMENETEHPFEPEPDVPPDVAYSDEADAGYAPPNAASEDADPVEVVASSGSDWEDDLPHGDDPAGVVAVPEVGDLDIEGALAAVASLSDMLAEEEAAEQARLVQAEAQARTAAERQARLERPELYFPMPPSQSLQRGQTASVVPAVLLILTGAWLTFAFTTSSAPPDAALIAAVAAGGVAITLLVRWLSSGRWARGSLFFALVLLLSGVTIIYLFQPSAPGLVKGWPLLLVEVGLAFLLTGVMAQPVDRRLLLPAIALWVAGLAALAVTMGVIDNSLLAAASAWWPVTLLVVALLWLLPLVFRQRR